MESRNQVVVGFAARATAFGLALVTAAAFSMGAAAVVTGKGAPLASAAGSLATAAVALVRGSLGL